MQIVFLGTSCAKPTKERNHSSIFLSHGSDGILFDCGEGTQRQLTLAGIKPTKVNKIFISHWHGDHTLGLSGLIQTLGISEYNKTLKIYGPEGTKKNIKLLTDLYENKEKIDLEVIDVKEGKICNSKDYLVEAYKLKHGTPTVGFRFIEKDRKKIKVSAVEKLGIPEGPLLGDLQEGKTITWKGKKISPKDTTYTIKGKIIAYVPDSVPGKNTLKIAENADVLITDSTYSHKMEKQAEEYMHLTAKQGADIANQANAKKLVLTHFSTRYKDTSELREEAEEIFPDVVCAEDFMKINL